MEKHRPDSDASPPESRVAKWSGVFPAALTMFDADGRLDEDGTAAHLDMLVQQGAHGVVVGGTSGEFIALSSAERRRLITLGVEAVGGRVPVLAGTGLYATDATIALTRAAADAGADAALVILPYYQRPSRAETMRHYRAVACASPIPVLAYNNPGNSAAPELRPEDLAPLWHAGMLHGVKSTFATVHQIHQTLALTDDAFRIFYGSFMAPLEALAGGAHGWISGILNVVLADALALHAAVRTSDLAQAQRAWTRILPIRELYVRQMLGPVSDLALYRGILRLRGDQHGHCRPPLIDLTAAQLDRLADLLGGKTPQGEGAEAYSFSVAATGGSSCG